MKCLFHKLKLGKIVMIGFSLATGLRKGCLPPTHFNPLNPELNPICYLLALLAHHFLHVSRIRVKPLTIRLLIYIYDISSLMVKMHLEYLLRIGKKWNDVSIPTGKRANSFLQLKLQLDVY